MNSNTETPAPYRAGYRNARHYFATLSEAASHVAVHGGPIDQLRGTLYRTLSAREVAEEIAAVTPAPARKCLVCLNPSDNHTPACRRNPANQPRNITLLVATVPNGHAQAFTADTRERALEIARQYAIEIQNGTGELYAPDAAGVTPDAIRAHFGQIPSESIVVFVPFNESDPATWENAPAGYAWHPIARDADYVPFLVEETDPRFDGERHLVHDDGAHGLRNVSRQYETARLVVSE